MFLRIIPILLIGIPIFGFFFDPEPPRPGNSIDSLVILLLTLPWYFKILSIGIGVIWISTWNKSDEEKES
jgi:hypothetical protein